LLELIVLFGQKEGAMAGPGEALVSAVADLDEDKHMSAAGSARGPRRRARRGSIGSVLIYRSRL